MTLTAEDRAIAVATAHQKLNLLNCPDGLDWRAEIVADHLGVADGVAFVPSADGTPRTIPDPLGSGAQLPYPIERAILEELVYTRCDLPWSGCGRIPGVARVPSGFLGYGYDAA